MAGGFAKDGAVQEQIDASINDEVTRARSLLPRGESAVECDECGTSIPEERRKVMPGVRLCVACQEASTPRSRPPWCIARSVTSSPVSSSITV